LEGDGIVLIDEIDLHLHPKWQEKIFPALQNTFPNIQFIVSTHAPKVLESVDENIQVIRLHEDAETHLADERLGCQYNSGRLHGYRSI